MTDIATFDAPGVRAAMKEAYAGICQYCGVSGADHLDHIMPKTLGGPDLITNITLSCRACNLIKGRFPLRHDVADPVLRKAAELAAAITARAKEIGPVRYVAAKRPDGEEWRHNSISRGMTPGTLEAARALLLWSREDLAAASGVDAATIMKLESGRTKRPAHETVTKIIQAFMEADVEFLDPGKPLPPGGPGVRLKEKGEQNG